MDIKKHLLNTDSAKKWERIGFKRRSGVLVPLFSVYSANSTGIGDLADAKLLIDWARACGNSILQFLPMNETGPLSCPYDSISSFALEPSYLSLEGLTQAKKDTIKDRLQEVRKLFPVGQAYVDYRIKKAKLNILKEIFSQQDSVQERGFEDFCAQNSYWLEDFSLYKVIKGLQAELPWYQWEDKFRDRHAAVLAQLRQEQENEIAFCKWIQWLTFLQFLEVKEYARRKKILLKGDLPILVSRDSADVWAHPEFFKLSFAAGAPPDMYCARGQRWGMPTHNWEAIAADDYRYLKERLKYAGNFYDILRIDHVVGLFRIWSIPYQEPLENQGLHGSFDPSEESRWKEHGTRLLDIINQNTGMLLCAEDLGVVPKACTEALAKSGIPGNDVQRWVKDWNLRHDFFKPEEYRLLSVAVLSTQDTTCWPAWWENEAGTVDEAMFRRKCSDHRQINFDLVKDKLFDMDRSAHGRLRWRQSIASVEILIAALGKHKEEVKDFIDMYLNSYSEKEKLWSHLGLPLPLREKSDKEIIQAALKMNLGSFAIFSVNTVIDLLFLDDCLNQDPYQYRINTPGTISEKNWSLRLPFSLEELLAHKVNKKIRQLVIDSSRK